MLSWEVQKEGLDLARFFDRFEKLRCRGQLLDYSLEQTSLHRVFLGMSSAAAAEGDEGAGIQGGATRAGP